MKRAAIFGMGAIGTSLASEWAGRTSWSLVAVCVRERRATTNRLELSPGVRLFDDLAEMLELSPDAVVEAAGHGAIRVAGPAILRAGCDLYLLSSGVLADPETQLEFLAAAEEGGGRIVIPTGALAGFDGLAALVSAGATEVLYRSVKPTRAWAGTHADETHDLGALTQPTVIFCGNAREAARLFPKNANLAASVALAGVGFESTRVELVADPAAAGNTAIIEARSPRCTLRVEMSGVSEPRNPRSSAIVRSSVLAALERSSARLTLG